MSRLLTTRFVFLSLLLVPLLLWGCSNGGSSATDPAAGAGSAVISGEVQGTSSAVSAGASPRNPDRREEKADRGTPISVFATAGTGGVRVAVEGTSLSTLTDAEGRFQLDGVPSGDIRIRFEVDSQVAGLPVAQVQPFEVIELAVRLQGSTVVVDSMHRSSDPAPPGGGDGTDVDLTLAMQPDSWNTQWTNSSGTVAARVTGNGYELVDPESVLLYGTDPSADSLVPLRVDVNGGQLRAFFAKGDALAILDDPQPGELHTVTLELAIDGEILLLTDEVRIVGPATGGDASIEIEKSTDGVDADLPPGPTLTVGDPVSWSYEVSNTGDESLTDILVVDDQGVDVLCTVFELAPGESMTCTGEGIAVAGQYANLGTVTASTAAGDVVVDDDPSHYFGEEDTGGGGGGGEGACGLGYWKNHPGDWPPTGYDPGQTVESVFAESSLFPEVAAASLSQALAFGGGPGSEGGARILLKQAVAALLNAAHPEISYPMPAAEVVAAVDAALASDDRSTMIGLAGELGDSNEGECPLP